MKTKQMTFLKIFIFSLFCFSCSDDNQTNEPQETNLVVKKIIQTTYYSVDNFDTSIQEFFYENNKLIKLTQGNYQSEFNYNGDKITQINVLSNNVLDNTVTLNYNGDLLSNILSGNNNEEKSEFSYTNNIVSKIESGFINNSIFIVQSKKEFTYNSIGNITQNLRTNYYIQPVTTTKVTYSYDDKNHPMKNMNKYFRLLFSSEGFNGLSTNNILLTKYFSTPTSTTSTDYYFTYIYNEDNYPIEIKRFASSDNFLISKTVIEYQ